MPAWWRPSRDRCCATTFTSIGYADILARAEELESQGKGKWPREKLARWQAIHRRITAAEREIELGSWMIRSTDGGRSWSSPYRCPVNSPHGPIQLSDGRLLYAGKIFWYGRPADNPRGASGSASPPTTARAGAGWPKSPPGRTTTWTATMSCMSWKQPKEP